MQKKITVDISPEGEIKIEAHGYSGGTCQEATLPLTMGLLGAHRSSSKKPEFYQPAAVNRLRETEGR